MMDYNPNEDPSFERPTGGPNPSLWEKFLIYLLHGKPPEVKPSHAGTQMGPPASPTPVPPGYQEALDARTFQGNRERMQNRTPAFTNYVQGIQGAGLPTPSRISSHFSPDELQRFLQGNR